MRIAHTSARSILWKLYRHHNIQDLFFEPLPFWLDGGLGLVAKLLHQIDGIVAGAVDEYDHCGDFCCGIAYECVKCVCEYVILECGEGR